jgi:alpha,alpha-trehalose phosphorylase
VYELREGPGLKIRHHGEEFMLGGEPAERPIKALTAAPRPGQPQGREPLPRRSDPHMRDTSPHPSP